MKVIKQFDLPPGVHTGNSLNFSEDGSHIYFEYRTYQEKGNWNNWSTTITCIEIETGKQTGTYQYPFEKDSPMFAPQQMADGTIVFTTWRKSPVRMIGLSFPDLKQNWDIELGDYVYAVNSVVLTDNERLAVICHNKTDMLNGREIDWDLVPQNELKIVSKEGKVLQTLVLPVGASEIAVSKDKKSVVIGALGSAYLVDLSEPFSEK